MNIDSICKTYAIGSVRTVNSGSKTVSHIIGTEGLSVYTMVGKILDLLLKIQSIWQRSALDNRRQLLGNEFMSKIVEVPVSILE